MHPKNKLFSHIILTLGCLYTALYLFSCTTPYLNPANGYLLTFSALFFPLILGGMLLWCLISLVFFRRYFIIFLICVGAGYQNIQSVFGFHTNHPFKQKKAAENIRVLSWNVNNFLSGAPNDTTKIQGMLAFIKNSDADIICFQDYSAEKNASYNANIDFICKSTKLPYYYFCEATYNYGVIIFSRWPFLKKYSETYENIGSREKLAYVDIQTPYKVLRVFNTHLSSMNIHVDKMYDDNANRFKFIQHDNAILMRKDKLSRLAYFDKLHAQQAEMVKDWLDSTDLPFIFTADLNAVPSSYVYHKISKGLGDAFLENGFGWGRTYDSLSPTLRIDVLLTSRAVKAVQYFSPHLHLSDHFPIITDIQIKP